MKFKNVTPEVVAEILLHIVENEALDSLKSLKSFSRNEVIEIIKELANSLKSFPVDDAPGQRPDYGELRLSPKAMSLLSSLSPREEALLFRSFRLFER